MVLLVLLLDGPYGRSGTLECGGFAICTPRRGYLATAACGEYLLAAGAHVGRHHTVTRGGLQDGLRFSLLGVGAITRVPMLPVSKQTCIKTNMHMSIEST